MKLKCFVTFVICAFISYNIKASTSHFNNEDNYIEFNISDIEKYDQRLYFLHQLYNNNTFNIALAEDNGIFYISLNDEHDEINLEEYFNSFYEDIDYEYNLISKDEMGELFVQYKNSLPEEFIHHIMMSEYIRSRDNNLCSMALPFCTDNGLYEFPAGVNAGQGESGPNYNCLSTTPNPAWYYMRIDNPGAINIYMYSTPSVDIDFCCWGPFDDPTSPCPNGLTGNKVVSCSYSGNPTETCQVPSTAQTGEFYILVITNYSNQTCNISFEKQSGSGTTDCSILPPLIDSNTPLCIGETLQLEAQEIGGAAYSWTGPGGWTSNLRNPSRPNVTLNMAGIYSCNITIDNQQSDAVTTEVDIFATATADFTNTTVCEGDPTQFTCTSTSNPANNISSREWDFGDGNTSTNTNPTHTYANSGTYTVSLTVKTGGDCEDTKTKTVTVYKTPDTNAGPDQTIEYSESTTLNGTAGEGDFTYRWEPAEMVVNPNSATTETISLTSSVLFTLTATNSQGDCTNSDEVLINVNGQAMSAIATTENNIICDTENTQLNVTATGGTHSYSYSWNPTTGLSNPNIANPVFSPENIDNSSQEFTFVCTVDDGQTTIDTDITILVNKAYPNIIINEELCQGDNEGLYQEFNFNISTMEYGTFHEVQELKTVNGCDSIISLNLTVNKTYSDTLLTTVYDTIETCDEDIYWADMLISETGDYEHLFTTENGSCDSLVRLHYVKNHNIVETVIDTICSDTYFDNVYNIYDWQFSYPGHYSGAEEIIDENGCKMSLTYELLLLNKLYASEISDNYSQIVYYSGTGFDFYDFSIDEVRGGGSDENIEGFTNIPVTYEWQVYMINGVDKWTCRKDGSNNTTVNITGQGAAYLYCDIHSLCEVTRKWMLLYTPGYRPCDDAKDLNVNNLSSEWAELRWQSPADSCIISYGTDENYSNSIITDKKIFKLENLTPNTKYFWKVKSLCDDNTDFVVGPPFTTKLNVDIDDNFIDNIVMYPNPAHDMLTIKGDNIKMIEIYNIIGDKVFSNEYKHNNNISINTDRFNEGLYIVRISLNDGRNGIKRLVIE